MGLSGRGVLERGTGKEEQCLLGGRPSWLGWGRAALSTC